MYAKVESSTLSGTIGHTDVWHCFLMIFIFVVVVSPGIFVGGCADGGGGGLLNPCLSEVQRKIYSNIDDYK